MIARGTIRVIISSSSLANLLLNEGKQALVSYLDDDVFYSVVKVWPFFGSIVLLVQCSNYC